MQVLGLKGMRTREGLPKVYSQEDALLGLCKMCLNATAVTLEAASDAVLGAAVTAAVAAATSARGLTLLSGRAHSCRWRLRRCSHWQQRQGSCVLA